MPLHVSNYILHTNREIQAGLWFIFVLCERAQHMMDLFCGMLGSAWNVPTMIGNMCVR